MLNDFKINLKNSANSRIRLLNIQNEIKTGKISETNLEKKDIYLLKQLYCEQIVQLTNSIKYYTKKIKV